MLLLSYRQYALFFCKTNKKERKVGRTSNSTEFMNISVIISRSGEVVHIQFKLFLQISINPNLFILFFRELVCVSHVFIVFHVFHVFHVCPVHSVYDHNSTNATGTISMKPFIQLIVSLKEFFIIFLCTQGIN